MMFPVNINVSLFENKSCHDKVKIIKCFITLRSLLPIIKDNEVRLTKTLLYLCFREIRIISITQIKAIK